MSEELENSLQQAVETYLNERLRSIEEQVARLQTELNEAVTRLQEASRTESLDGTSLSAAIFAHLQTARGQRLSGAMLSSPGSAAAGPIKRAVADIESQDSQTEILKALLRGAAQFAERAALFVVKNGQAIGWRVCVAGNPNDLQLIGGVSLPLTSEASLTKAVRSQAAWSGAARSDAADHSLLDQLGGAPEIAAVVPLIVRGKAVAVLYADSASSDSAAINSDALEVLARVAAMAVNVVSIQRGAASAAKGEAAVTTKPAETPAAEYAVEPAPAYTPQIEPQAEEADLPTVATAVPERTAEAQPAESTPQTAERATAPVPESVAMEAPAEAVSEVETVPEPAAEPRAEQPTAQEVAPVRTPADGASAVEETQPAPAPPPAPTEPAFASQYATPLGSVRRFGVTEPELPIEVGEEERRLHNDARRFARLLVSEIKLYNENKVKDGRSNADLYDRLRDDIDRSRQMYDKRVAPPVAARHDYFHQELVNLLAEGDAAKLGQSYPGASATA